MNKLINLVLILGFLFVDFLFFHDLLKPGESTSFAQYLVGALSLLVFISAGLSLAKSYGLGRKSQ